MVTEFSEKQYQSVLFFKMIQEGQIYFKFCLLFLGRRCYKENETVPDSGGTCWDERDRGTRTPNR